jgi:hypothetical protein
LPKDHVRSPVDIRHEDGGVPQACAVVRAF